MASIASHGKNYITKEGRSETVGIAADAFHDAIFTQFDVGIHVVDVINFAKFRVDLLRRFFCGDEICLFNTILTNVQSDTLTVNIILTVLIYLP